MPKNGDDKMSGLQKAAVLLITLGPERSAGIFKHLKEEEIEDLTLEIANTRSVTPQAKEAVINEFYELCLAQQYIAEGGISYAKELLEHALGNEKAVEIIGKLTSSLQVKPFEFIRKTDAAQLLNFIQDEHPQTIALICPTCRQPRQRPLFPPCLPTDRRMLPSVLPLWTGRARMSSRKWKKYWKPSWLLWSHRITPLSVVWMR